MTQDKHTPGLLVAVRNSAFWEVDPAQDRGDGVLPFTVANFCPSDPGNETGLQEANARRVVAAWNACECIPTAALDAGVVKDMVALLIELVDIEGPMPGTSEWGDKARAAIARATGDA